MIPADTKLYSLQRSDWGPEIIPCSLKISQTASDVNSASLISYEHTDLANTKKQLSWKTSIHGLCSIQKLIKCVQEVNYVNFMAIIEWEL